MKVIVIGGGTSGLMASVSAAMHGAEVVLLEKNPTLGKKLLHTGGTRCNVTNRRTPEEIVKHIPGNGRFLYSAFSQFDNQDIIQFFESRGVRLKEEDYGRMFPVTDSAKTILETFIQEIKKLGVQVRTNVKVKTIRLSDGAVRVVELDNGEQLEADAVILATGGKSYPKTGSTGDGYGIAKVAGHTITPLFATEVPLTSGEEFIKKGELRALSLRNVALSVLNGKGKPVVTHQMDMIFTHFGVSGPAVLRCSSFVHQVQEKEGKKEVVMSLNALPDMSDAELDAQFRSFVEDAPLKSIKNHLKGLLPERYVEFLLARVGISDQTAVNRLSEANWAQIKEVLTNFRFTVNGSLPIEKGFVTGGGVHLKEVNPKTLESKLTQGLYFCGELLDIHGYTGGYNITAAFVTGYVAGMHASLGY